MSSWPMAGVHRRAGARNDILVNGLKVSGTAQRIYHNRILHHGNAAFRLEFKKITVNKMDPDNGKEQDESPALCFFLRKDRVNPILYPAVGYQ